MKMSFKNLWKAVGALVTLQALPTTWMNHSGFRMQCSICLQVKSVQDGMHARDRSWCRLMPFMVCLGGQKWVEVVVVFLGNSVEASESIRTKTACFVLNRDWGLNRISKKDHYPLPLISDLLDTPWKAWVYTKIDLWHAYILYRFHLETNGTLHSEPAMVHSSGW